MNVAPQGGNSAEIVTVDVLKMDAIRLLDGSRAYLHAVIDNFSRRILSWKVAPTFDPTATAQILLTVSKGMGNDKPMLLTDGGVENVNGAVDALVASGLLSRMS